MTADRCARSPRRQVAGPTASDEGAMGLDGRTGPGPLTFGKTGPLTYGKS